MITLGSATKVHLLAGVTDMRRGFEGLFALARALLEADPLSGHVFVREEQLRLARLEKYGPKSEQLSQDQVLLLDLEPGVQAEEVAKEAALPEAEKRLKGSPAKTQRTGPRYSKAHPGPIPLPAHLPRREVIIPCEEGAGGELVGYEVRGSKKESSFRPTKPGCRFCSKRARDATTPHGSGNTPNPEVWFTSTIKTVAAGLAPATFSAILRVVCKPTATKCTRHWVLTLLKTRSIPSCQKTGNLRQPELEFHPPTPIPAGCDHAHSPTLPSSPLSCVFMPATLRGQTAPATRGY